MGRPAFVEEEFDEALATARAELEDEAVAAAWATGDRGVTSGR
jgi:hypothetical protein